MKNNGTDELSGKSSDITGVIAGGVTGALIFVLIVVVVVYCVKRRILRNKPQQSVEVRNIQT